MCVFRRSRVYNICMAFVPLLSTFFHHKQSPTNRPTSAKEETTANLHSISHYNLNICNFVLLLRFPGFHFMIKTILFVANIFGGYLTVSVVVVVRNIYIRSFSHDPHVLCGQENSYYIWIFRTVFQIM